MAKVVPFCTMIKGLSELVSTTDAHELAIMVAEKSGLYASYKADTSIEGLSRVANLDELLNSVSSFIEEREMEAEGSDASRKRRPQIPQGGRCCRRCPWPAC